jgi:hypothetical protein
MEVSAMRIGDTVRVRASGREGQIVEDLERGRHRVEYYPVANTMPVDTANIEDDEAGGIFSTEELEPL